MFKPMVDWWNGVPSGKKAVESSETKKDSGSQDELSVSSSSPEDQSKARYVARLKETGLNNF